MAVGLVPRWNNIEMGYVVDIVDRVEEMGLKSSPASIFGAISEGS
jgi:hypothetical protein